MKTKSIWGNPPKRIYKLLNYIKKNSNNNTKICIVGCSDGKFLMPFARAHIKSIGYDIDQIALFGGKKFFPIEKNPNRSFTYKENFISDKFTLEEKRVVGIIERINIENLKEYTEIRLLDFYKETPKEKFDLVFTSCSLHYSKNVAYSLEEKIKKLQSIVKVGGLLYIDYMMAIEEDNYELYPKMKFFRKSEIKDYFDDDFEIISIKENNKATFEKAHVDCTRDHFHRFGYVYARRVK